MRGRISAKVVETGRDAKINNQEPLKRPLEYVVTDKWDALAQDEMSNVDAGKSDERGIGVSGKVEYSRALSDSGSLKRKPVILYDIGDESNSVLSYANSSVFSRSESSVLRRLEEKVVFLCEHMTCTRIDDSSYDEDDNYIQKRRTGLYPRQAKEKCGIEASKCHDFSLDSFDSDIVEDISTAASLDEDTLEEDMNAKDEFHVKKYSKGDIEAPILKIRAKNSLEENKLHVQEPPRMPPVRFEGKNHLTASTLLTDDTSVVDKESLHLDETGTIPGRSPKKAEDSALNLVETVCEKIMDENEEFEEMPCIEYTLSSHEKEAESNELDDIEVDVLEVDKYHFEAPVKEASTSTSPGDCDDSILERTYSLTETEDSSTHVTDDIITDTLGSIDSLTSGCFSKNDEVFVAPDFEYTLSTLKKHSFDADAVAAMAEDESSKTPKVATLVSMGSFPKHLIDEDAEEIPSIQYTLTNGKSVEETGSSADKDYSSIAGDSIPSLVDNEDAEELPSIEYTLSDDKIVEETSSSTDKDYSAIADDCIPKYVDDEDAAEFLSVEYTLTDDKSVEEIGSSSDKDYSSIAGKREKDADQACKTTGRKYRPYLWRRFERPSATAVAKSVQRTTKATDDKSADNVNFLTAGKSKTDADQVCKTMDRKYTRYFWRRSDRPSAMAAAKLVHRTTEATNGKSAVSQVKKKDVVFTGSKMTDDKNTKETGSIADKVPSPDSMQIDHVATESSVLAYAEETSVMDLIPGKSETDAIQALSKRDELMVIDAILGMSETDTNKTSTIKNVSNEPEPNSETSEPRKGFINRARSRSRSVTRGLKVNRRSPLSGRQSSSETDTNKTSTIKNASNEPEPNSETSEPRKGFINRARSRSRSVTRGLKVNRCILSSSRQSSSETDTNKTSTSEDASNEPEQNSESSAPRKGFLHRARSRSRSVTRGLEANRRSPSFSRQSSSETDSDKTSANKDASNDPEPNSETSERRKGFLHRARRSRSVTRGLKANRHSLSFGRQSRSETEKEKTSTNEDASNEPDPNSETSERRKGLLHRARSRSRSVTRGLMADQRSRSDGSPERASASFRFPWWFTPRREQTMDAGEEKAAPNIQRMTKITIRQKERKKYAYKEMDDDETVDNLYQCYKCSCLPE